MSGKAARNRSSVSRLAAAGGERDGSGGGIGGWDRGLPSRFAVQLQATGSLTLTWECKNPRGSEGTIYQVWRRLHTAN